MEGNYLAMWNKAQEKGSMHLLYDDMANQCMLILCLICMSELNPAPVWVQRAPLHCSQPFLFLTERQKTVDGHTEIHGQWTAQS